MTPPSERAPQGGLGRLVVAAVLFTASAPVALAALPLAALLLISRPQSAAERLLAALAGGFSVWWLAASGDVPDQMLRAAAVIGTTAFLVVTLRTRIGFAHRAILAVAIALASVSALLPLVGSSWGELHWWVAHQAGATARQTMGLLLQAAGGGATGEGLTSRTLAELEAGLDTMVRVIGDFFPAITALEMLAGLTLAAAVYQRVARRPVMARLGPFRAFRFSEHLGWAAVIPLVIVLLPRLGATKLVAANVLLVAGVLYALRGAAVASFGLKVVGAGGFFLWMILALMVLLMLPAVVGGAILLGVLDAGLDLRRRWSQPPVGK